MLPPKFGFICVLRKSAEAGMFINRRTGVETERDPGLT
jgi:hypothetical protein